MDVTDPVGGDEEPSGGNTDYTMEKYRRYLEGEWAGVEGEIEGDRYKLADEEMSLTLTFMSADGVTEDGHGTWSMGAWYEYTDSYGNHEKLDGLHVEFHKGPMYYGCANEVRGAGGRPGERGVHRDRHRQQRSGAVPLCEGFSHGMVRQLRAVGRPVDRGIATVFHYRRK